MSAVPQAGFWQRQLWSLVFPRPRQRRAEATPAGLILMLVAFGLGLAAYNSSNNILFITLSMLLGSLVMSGVLSQLNLRAVRAEVATQPRDLVVGESISLQTRVGNERRQLVSMGLWLDWSVEPLASYAEPAAKPDTSNKGLRKRLARSQILRQRGRTPITEPIPAGQMRSVQVDWVPPHRGPWLLRVESVGSLFPFGFLRKYRPSDIELRLIVRPARLAYRTQALSVGGRRGSEGSRRFRGQGSDLAGLRDYRRGDSPRLIHWKASARQRRLLIKESLEECEDCFVLLLGCGEGVWSGNAQFEQGLALACSLAEDLFHEGRLRAVGLHGGASSRVRGLGDLEHWLDQVSCLRHEETSLEAEAGVAGDGGIPGSTELLILPYGRESAAVYQHGQVLHHTEPA